MQAMHLFLFLIVLLSESVRGLPGAIDPASLIPNTRCGKSIVNALRINNGDPFDLELANPRSLLNEAAADDPFGLERANAHLDNSSFNHLGARDDFKAVETIVGGTPAKLGDICWQAKVHRDSFFVCGGSIIGRRTILTASHCVINFQNGRTNAATRFKVVVGAMESGTSMQTGDPNGCAQEFNVVYIQAHQRFNKKSNENDIAILTLDDDIDFRLPCVCPVCLTETKPREGQICTVSGYGLEREGGAVSSKTKLQFVNINVLPTKWGTECYIQRDGAGGPDLKNIMCAGNSKNKDSCQGDSGGPVVCFDKSTRSHFQAGVVSYGIGCGRGIPGVYTRISSYLDWIKENSREKDLLAFA